MDAVVVIPVDGIRLEGVLTIPAGASGAVLFAHGSGSSRHSPRNQYVAQILRRSGMATLLVDLLTFAEEAVDEKTGHLRFDIPLLGRRLVGIVDWLAADPRTSGLPVGCFGASTGAAAALIAAAERPARVRAVVSRGGRPDLAGPDVLRRVRAPTLLVVGGADTEVIDLNREAARFLEGGARIEIVPEATHLFEEPGALEEVARLAAEWFEIHLERKEGEP